MSLMECLDNDLYHICGGMLLLFVVNIVAVLLNYHKWKIYEPALKDIVPNHIAAVSVLVALLYVLAMYMTDNMHADDLSCNVFLIFACGISAACHFTGMSPQSIIECVESGIAEDETIVSNRDDETGWRVGISTKKRLLNPALFRSGFPKLFRTTIACFPMWRQSHLMNGA